MRRKVITMHIGVTSALLGGLTLLFKYGDRSPDRSLYHTVHLTALSVVAAAFYYCLFEMCRQIAPQDWGLGRRANGHTYASVDCERSPLAAPPADSDDRPPPEPARACRERPRLTMDSIWGLVYGLGCVFFVALYCASGQQAVCSYFFGLGLACMTFDELLRPLRFGPHAWRQRALEAGAVVLSCLCIVLVSVHDALSDQIPIDFENVNLFSVLTGMVLPLLAPLLLGTLKNPTGYCVGDMLELCEFGLPFTFIIGCGFVVMADGNSVHLVESTFVPILYSWNKTHALPSNATSAPVSNGTHSLDWERLQLVAPVVALAPLLGLPTLLFITTATLREHVSDPLVSLSLVVAGKALLDEGLLILSNPLCLAAIVSAKLGLLSRLASSSFEEDPRADPVVQA
jgi:hypothetical protein